MPGNNIAYGLDYRFNAPNIPVVLVHREPEVGHWRGYGRVIDPMQFRHFIGVETG